MLLLEREDPLAAIRDLTRAAVEGRGGALCVCGEPGVGKTSLLAEAARTHGTTVRVLRARGGEREQHFAMGIARQLFVDILLEAAPPERETLFAGAAGLAAPVLGWEARVPALADSDAGEAAMYGLFWLASNIAERTPMLLSIDDAHWADDSSLAWLRYLTRRIDALPIAVAAAGRLEEPSGDWIQLTDEPNVDRLDLQPLSRDGVATLLREQLGEAPDARFVAKGHEVTGGNPFLLSEIVTAIRAEARPTGSATIGWLDTVAPQRVSRNVTRRLDELSPDAGALTRAAAVLGGDAGVGPAAALAGLSDTSAARATDELAAARLVRAAPAFGFVHPLVEHALYTSIPAGVRGAEHARAARILQSRGGDAEAIAAHLLQTPAGNAPWVIEPLRRAAEVARRRGSPATAAVYLRRALLESQPRASRFRLLAAVGEAEAFSRPPDAVQHLEEARSFAPDARAFATASIALGQVFLLGGSPDASVRVLREAVARLGDSERELALLLAVELLTAARTAGETDAGAAAAGALPGDLAGDSPAERAALAALAADAGWAGESAAETTALARKALAGGRLLLETPSNGIAHSLACAALTWTDAAEEACAHFGAALELARSRGSVAGAALVQAWRAEAWLRRGSVREAEADAEGAIALTEQTGPAISTLFALGWLVGALVERDELEEADRVVARAGLDGDVPRAIGLVPLLSQRAQLRLAQGRYADALNDALAAGKRLLDARAPSPAMVPWRTIAATAALALEDRGEASRLITEELERARRFGAPRPLGVALRARARLEPRFDDRIEILRESVATLADSEARLDHGWSLAALGVALRQSSHAPDARPVLAGALDVAMQCGATRLARMTREELAAAGARPRRDRISGRDALTASERRVADLALAGGSNRDIAQQLFLTVKTVESHLSRAYRKLGIARRQDLHAALQQHRDQ